CCNRTRGAPEGPRGRASRGGRDPVESCHRVGPDGPSGGGRGAVRGEREVRGGGRRLPRRGVRPRERRGCVPGGQSRAGGGVVPGPRPTSVRRVRGPPPRFHSLDERGEGARGPGPTGSCGGAAPGRGRADPRPWEPGEPDRSGRRTREVLRADGSPRGRGEDAARPRWTEGIPPRRRPPDPRRPV